MDFTKKITSHQINECNQAIEISASEPDPKNGNASHFYLLDVAGRGGPLVTELAFQNGPIKEVGTNGITHEALLAVLIDRLQGFQSGPFACRENAIALTKIQEAAMWLHSRTKTRVERGVEGTHTV